MILNLLRQLLCWQTKRDIDGKQGSSLTIVDSTNISIYNKYFAMTRVFHDRRRYKVLLFSLSVISEFIAIFLSLFLFQVVSFSVLLLSDSFSLSHLHTLKHTVSFYWMFHIIQMTCSSSSIYISLEKSTTNFVIISYSGVTIHVLQEPTNSVVLNFITMTKVPLNTFAKHM